MKKWLRIAALVAILGFGSTINAEQSGGFIGLEVGYGWINTEQVLRVNFAGGGLRTEWVGELNGGGVNAGFTAGYKQFFGNYFGLRYFVNVNATYATLNANLFQTGQTILQDVFTKSQYSALLINYGANIDMLINFLSIGRNDFGMFVGASVGGNNWSGSAIKEIENFLQIRQNANITQGIDWKMKRNFLDFAINAGLRTNIATNHGLELGVRVSLLNNVFINKERTNNIGSVSIQSNTKKYNLSTTLRYTYTFGGAKRVSQNINRNRPTRNPNAIQRQQPQVRQPIPNQRTNNIQRQQPQMGQQPQIGQPQIRQQPQQMGQQPAVNPNINIRQQQQPNRNPNANAGQQQTREQLKEQQIYQQQIYQQQQLRQQTMDNGGVR